MQQQISLITLGVEDVARSLDFYRMGFGWEPVFTAPGVAFFQMNGLVFALWGRDELSGDMRRGVGGPGAIALAHNVASREEADCCIAELVEAGGTLLRAADEPPHGGYRGYVADPDGHAWEIAWNPAWRIDAEGHVCFAGG
jgi:hypothetical protein